MSLLEDPTQHPVFRVLQILSESVAKVSAKEAGLIQDPATAIILLKLAHWHAREETGSARYGSVLVLPQRTLARASWVSLKACRARLEALARYGIVKVISCRLKGSRRREASRFELHPSLAPGFSSGRMKAAEVMSFCRWAFEFGEARPASETPLQGFGSSVPYLAPEEGDPLSIAECALKSTQAPEADKRAEELMAATRIDARALQKEQRQREAAEWRKKGRDFVRGAARLWNYSQVKVLGRPDVMPIWDGEPGQLSKPNRDQYQALVKVFESAGGLKAAMGWYCFCVSQPMVDAKGQPKFDPGLAHRQWASLEKQPAFFAKYFDSVMADPFVRETMTTKEARDQLVMVFGEAIVKQEPRWQHTERLT